ncbi:hypothetical protein WCD74_08195 [Actinomycetospora sp. OC33-EN08]|uniref:MarR family transcriptional regulator n=1 Tax=Actinomycetospora aurantiaca TaxID=3129233 RepID=A0ABU8MK95_9PSEU
MLEPHQLALHTLTLRQLASAEQAAHINGLPEADVATALDRAVADGHAITARGSYMITPAGRSHLDGLYVDAFAAIRSDDEIGAAMESFEEGVNKQVLALTTEWQTVDVDGVPTPNDHSDSDRDAKILDRLGRVLEKTRKVLAPLATADPLLDRFADRLDAALTRAEGGETDHVSGVRVDSVHTVWFQMHEHVLRLTGRERPE